jgi:YD repeat-containing protein
MKIEINTDLENVAFPIIIKDKKGNEIYCQWENGTWFEYTYDEKGNVLTYKDSDGYWYEITYDDNGNELTFKNSNDAYKIKGFSVTKREFEAFVNTPEYTMEELVSKIGNFRLKK